MLYQMRTVEKEIERVVEWIKSQVKGTGADKVILGISGGKDSTVAAALCVKAIGKENVYGVMMPCGEQSDLDDSCKVIEQLGIVPMYVNIEDTYNTMANLVSGGEHEKRDIERTFSDETGHDKTIKSALLNTSLNGLSNQASINLKPRIRMATLYMLAQTLGNCRVCGTGNASEIYVGYCTKFGDTGNDFNPLGQYTKSQVVEIGLALAEELGIDPELIKKVPSDGLCGKTDEDNLGFTYDVLDRYLETGEIDDEDAKKKIDRMHLLSYHKVLGSKRMG